MIVTTPEVIEWPVPAGVAPRGIVIVVPGRGEHPGAYERLGRRLSVDGYPVRVLGLDPSDRVGALVGYLRETAARGEPVIALVGSDTGGLVVLAAQGELATSADSPAVSALVVAGVPVAEGTVVAEGLEAELEVRSACPVHRGRLSDAANLDVGALADPVDPVLRAAAVTAGRQVEVPVLVLHGGNDIVVPAKEVWAEVLEWPSAVAVSVSGGLHDVLNDVNHRSVAARIIQLLEQVRLGSGAPDILSKP